MQKLQQLAAIQSATKPLPPLKVAMGLSRPLGINPGAVVETRYVLIEGLTDLEMDEEVLVSTPLGRLKKVSLLCLHCRRAFIPFLFRSHPPTFCSV
jgi:hypothetical protein